MDIRVLTDTYSVSPQISPDDVPDIAAAGYRTIVCNRPDAEVPTMLQAAAMREAVEAAGLAFVDNPITHGGMSFDQIDLQRDAITGSPGPVLAYCASGTRSTIIWSFGAVATLPVDDVLAAATGAGYALEGLRPQLEALSAS